MADPDHLRQFVRFRCGRIRSGLPLPPPILAVLLVMALAMVPLGIVQDNLGEEAVVDDSIRLGDPSMNAASGLITSPSEVMGGADLMLVSADARFGKRSGSPAGV